MDQFISENKLEWIPYDKFQNIEYLEKGGFGTIYYAMCNSYNVILKSFNYLNNSDERLNEFLNEWKIIDSERIIRIYGFTKNPDASNYILIMQYTNKGNIRGCLSEITKNWKLRLLNLYKINTGLNKIHEKGLIHYNLHDGLYQLAKSFLKENNIYGICKGERPEIIENTPQCYVDLMKKCWDEDPLKRPSSEEVLNIFTSWVFYSEEVSDELKSNIMEFINAPIEHNNLTVEPHPKACYTSHLLDFTSKELNEILEESQELSSFELKQDVDAEQKLPEFINAPIGHNNLTIEPHPKACYTSHLLDFTGKELNENLEESQELSSFELKQDVDAEQELLELEKIAETYYQNFQNELKEKQLAYQNIQMELTNLQEKNSQFEQNNQSLRLNMTVQIKEFAKKLNTLQTQITYLQNEKQTLAGNLTEQLKQISQLNQENNNLQNQLTQSEANIQELKSQQDQIEEENLKLENELVDLQQRNFKFEQDNQNLRLKSAVQIKEFAEKENIFQTQIINLQNEKQNLAGNLTEQLEQNKLTNQQVQIQISQLEQEKIDLQEKLTQTEVKIQELKSHKEGLIKQKEQLENRLNQSQVNYEQIEQEKTKLQSMVKDLSQDQKLKVKLEKEIAQLEQKLISEKQIKMQLTQALQIKEGKINELEQSLINLDQKRIKQLKDKEKELNKVKGELVNKLTSGENTKKIHKEKEAKQKELVELQQELSRTSTSYDANRKKQVLNQVNDFLKAKEDFLTLREEAIKKLQRCFDCLDNSINKDSNSTSSTRVMKTSESIDKYTKEFQNILVKYNDESLWLNKNYYSLKKIVQENKELEVSIMIENILKLNSFNLDKYNIFKFATNSQEGTTIQLNSNMMAEDINSLRKNLDELKLELKQEKEGLKI
ncbi:kinase-like domain-containing protein [Rhizophagus irregularis DAOM 181602=DAOM 197198]|nr:kinase-like domain-containing protein [Rhizophagus irregularis DAOM 181602=DAOM 197198]